jgi:hypothetical protein
MSHKSAALKVLRREVLPPDGAYDIHPSPARKSCFDLSKLLTEIKLTTNSDCAASAQSTATFGFVLRLHYERVQI